jgi:hypothetical protein
MLGESLIHCLGKQRHFADFCRDAEGVEDEEWNKERKSACREQDA